MSMLPVFQTTEPELRLIINNSSTDAKRSPNQNLPASGGFVAALGSRITSQHKDRTNSDESVAQ